MSATDNYRVTMERVERKGAYRSVPLFHSNYKQVDVEAESNAQAERKAELENSGWRSVRATRAKPRSTKA